MSFPRSSSSRSITRAGRWSREIPEFAAKFQMVRQSCGRKSAVRRGTPRLFGDRRPMHGRQGCPPHFGMAKLEGVDGIPRSKCDDRKRDDTKRDNTLLKPRCRGQYLSGCLAGNSI
jgi:hypothetical protein